MCDCVCCAELKNKIDLLEFRNGMEKIERMQDEIERRLDRLFDKIE